ncbi:MAG: hypothetical protein QOD36_1517 [Mycobacterium sp.]|jgi:hypothetical protein|nr:hypothetical protein [Mycobacterium sp.]
MRIEDGPLRYGQAREIFEGELEHYLAGGDLLPTCGGLSVSEIDSALGQVAGAVIEGRDPSDAVAAAPGLHSTLGLHRVRSELS